MYRHHLEKLARTRLDDVLLDEGVLEKSRIEEAQAEQEKTGQQLSQILFEKDAIDEWDLAKVVTTHYQLPFVDVQNFNLRREVISLLPLEFCRKYVILPLDRFGDTMTVAVCEMPSPELIQQIVDKTGATPFLYVAVRRSILDALEAERKKEKKPEAAPVPAPQPAAVARPAAKSVLRETIADASDPLQNLPIPKVSMKLNASAATVGAPRSPAVASAARRTVTEKVVPPSIPERPFPVAAASAAASAANDPPRPRLSSRHAPVLPAVEVPKKLSGEKSAAEKTWQSIFDLGEDAVKKAGRPPSR